MWRNSDFKKSSSKLVFGSLHRISREMRNAQDDRANRLEYAMGSLFSCSSYFDLEILAKAFQSAAVLKRLLEHSKLLKTPRA